MSVDKNLFMASLKISHFTKKNILFFFRNYVDYEGGLYEAMQDIESKMSMVSMGKRKKICKILILEIRILYN